MSLESVRAFFADHKLDLPIIELDVSTATVALAAEAHGVEAGRIAKTLAFRLADGRAILLVARGDARIDNRKFKDSFGKGKMMAPHDVEKLTGHPVGGVCPFGLAEPLPVYADRSLQDFDEVLPAAGAVHSAVRITPALLVQLTCAQWVDVCQDASDLLPLTRRTLSHYEARAEAFRTGTRDHDVRQNIDALLSRITAPSPFTLLDFGCGPGRDLKSFRVLGHVPIGLDGSASFAAMARADTGCEVWQQDFLALELPEARFDGVFANASLFHVPLAALPRVLRQLHATLKPGGVLFSSNPHGHNEAGWNGDRYGVYHDLDAWRGFMNAASFEELLVYYRPDGLPREQQPWLATVWRAIR